MPPELRTWTCGRCERTILVPTEQGSDGQVDAVLRIREHRFGHLTEALMHGSDEDLWGLSEDDSESADPRMAPPSPEQAEDMVDVALRATAAYGAEAPPELVDSDDVAPVLEGITELLRADLPRARGVWYPINPDGSFNREED